MNRRWIMGPVVILTGVISGRASGAPPQEPAASGRPLDAWVRQLRDAEVRGRRQAARALGQMGPAARPAVTALAQALGDPDTEVARRAARALRRIGPGAAPAVPVWIQALRR